MICLKKILDLFKTNDVREYQKGGSDQLPDNKGKRDYSNNIFNQKELIEEQNNPIGEELDIQYILNKLFEGIDPDDYIEDFKHDFLDSQYRNEDQQYVNCLFGTDAPINLVDDPAVNFLGIKKIGSGSKTIKKYFSKDGDSDGHPILNDFFNGVEGNLETCKSILLTDAGSFNVNGIGNEKEIQGATKHLSNYTDAASIGKGSGVFKYIFQTELGDFDISKFMILVFTTINGYLRNKFDNDKTYFY